MSLSYNRFHSLYHIRCVFFLRSIVWSKRRTNCRQSFDLIEFLFSKRNKINHTFIQKTPSNTVESARTISDRIPLHILIVNVLYEYVSSRIVTHRVVTHSTYMLPPTEPNTVRIPRRGGVCMSCAKCFRCICFSGCLSYIPTITAAYMTWRYTPRRSPSMFTCRFIDKRSFITRFDSICLRSMSVELYAAYGLLLLLLGR